MDQSEKNRIVDKYVDIIKEYGFTPWDMNNPFVYIYISGNYKLHISPFSIRRDAILVNIEFEGTDKLLLHTLISKITFKADLSIYSDSNKFYVINNKRLKYDIHIWNTPNIVMLYDNLSDINISNSGYVLCSTIAESHPDSLTSIKDKYTTYIYYRDCTFYAGELINIENENYINLNNIGRSRQKSAYK